MIDRLVSICRTYASMDTRDDTNQVDEKTSQHAAMLLTKMLQVRIHDAAISTLIITENIL